MRRSTSMNALFGVLLLALTTVNGARAASSNLDKHEHNIFNPDTAAAFKVGLANVAGHSRPRRANAFGSIMMDVDHKYKRASSTRNRRQSSNNIGDVLGDNGDILDINDIGNNALALEVVTSGSTSTTLTRETVYVTTLQGERTTITDQVTITVVPTRSPSSSSASATSSKEDEQSTQQAIASRTPLNGAAASSALSTSERDASSSSARESSSSAGESSSSSSERTTSSSSSARPTSSSSSSSSSASSVSLTLTREDGPSSSARPSSSSSSARESESSSSDAKESQTSSSDIPSSSASSSVVASSSSASSSGSSSSSSTSGEESSSSTSERSSSSASPSSTTRSGSSSAEESTTPTATSSESETNLSASSASSSSGSAVESTSSSSSSSSSVSASASKEEESSYSLSSATLPLATSSSVSRSSSSSSSEITTSASETESKLSVSPSSVVVSEELSTAPEITSTSVFESTVTDKAGAVKTDESTTTTDASVISSRVSVSDDENVTSSTRSNEVEESTARPTPASSSASVEESSSTTSSTREREESTISSEILVTPSSTSGNGDEGHNGTTSTTRGGDDNTSTSRISSVYEEPSGTPTSSNGSDQPSETPREPASNSTTTTRGPDEPVTTTRITSEEQEGGHSSDVTSTVSQGVGSVYPNGTTETATISHESSEDSNSSSTLKASATGTATITASGRVSPNATLSTATTGGANATATLSDSVSVTESTDTASSTSDFYDWVPTSALLANSVPVTTETTSSVPTESASDITDSKYDGVSESTSTTSSFAPFPSEWPSVIVPTDSSTLTTLSTVPQGQTLISILFTDALAWGWVLENPDASAQVFAFMPNLIATAVNISSDEVYTDKLVAYQPDTYDGSTGTILSVYLGYIPASYVDALSAAIKAPNSAFYTKSSGIPLQLSKVVNPTLPVMAYASQGISSSAVETKDANGNIVNTIEVDNNNSSEEKKRKTIIIAVVTSIGIFVLGLLSFFAFKRARKNSKNGGNRSPDMQNHLRGFQLQGDRGTNAHSHHMMSQHPNSRSAYMPNEYSQHQGDSQQYDNAYAFPAGRPYFGATVPASHQNPFRISSGSSSNGSSEDSHEMSSHSGSSDDHHQQQQQQSNVIYNRQDRQHWTGPRRAAGHAGNTSGRSSSIDFNSVEGDEVRNSWWRFSDGFGRAFSSPNQVMNTVPEHSTSSSQQQQNNGPSSSMGGPAAASSHMSSTFGGASRAHVRNSARRVNIQRGPRGDLSSAISRPQMQENSLML